MKKRAIIGDSYPLLPSQTQIISGEIFTLQRLKSHQFNLISHYMIIRKNCNLDCLEKALNKVIESNDTLRLALFFKGLRIHQGVQPYQPRTFERIQLNGDEALKSYTQNLMKGQTVSMFGDSLVWAVLADLGNGDGALVIRIHHVCFDGYSSSLLFQQLEKYYDAYINDEEPEIKRLFSLIDVINSMSKYLKSDEYKEDRKFWQKSFLRQRKYSIPTGNGPVVGDNKECIFEIDGTRYQRLKEITKNTKTSFPCLIQNMVVLTTYKLTGKNNFALTTLSHGRMIPKHQKTMGCFMNLVPIFYDVDKNTKADEWLNRSYVDYLNHLAHARYPFMHGLPWSYPEAFRNGCNFNHAWIMFSYMTHGQYANKSKYEYYDFPSIGLQTRFYLYLDEPSDSSARVTLIYQSPRYSEEDVERYKTCFLEIIDRMLQTPDSSIADLLEIN